MNMYIGENIKRLRREKNITQEKLAEHLRISCQAISKWERGETFPDITLVIPIAGYFGVSTDELLGVDHAKNEQKIRDQIFRISNNRFGRNYQVGEIKAELGLQHSLSEMRNITYSSALAASVADFDRVFDQGMSAYLTAGGQAIINERRTAWQRVYGDAVNVPR